MVWEEIQKYAGSRLPLGVGETDARKTVSIKIPFFQNKKVTWKINKELEIVKVVVEPNGLWKLKEKLHVPKSVIEYLGLPYIVYREDEGILYFGKYKAGEKILKDAIKKAEKK